ncbi:MAG: hypothetical protein IH847_06370 [Acidobacteria bacterium]|nr:hypothetical protein [Acidobacteriota bacterium]
MPSVPSLSFSEHGTGTRFEDWLCAEMADHRSGLDQRFEGKLSYALLSTGTMSTLADLLEDEEGNITDPGAQGRVVEGHLADMARNLGQLALVAKALIPDLRDMTASERRNLRQYYKKLYRKVSGPK